MAQLTVNPDSAISKVLAGHIKVLLDLARAETFAEDGRLKMNSKTISSDGDIDTALTLMSDGRVIVEWDCNL